MTVIEAQHLSFAYPHDPPVLSDVSLEIGREVVALTGASGTGKTTLLMCLAGVLVPDSGSISVAGIRLDGAGPEERSRARRELIGLVFQYSELVAELTLQQNVALPLELLGESRGGALAAAHDLLDELGIAEVGRRFPGQVSGGQAQRAAVARALVHRPRVVLADEPTGSLDADNAERVLGLLLGAARRRGTAVLLVTHDAGVAAHADRVLDASSLSLRPTAPALL